MPFRPGRRDRRSSELLLRPLGALALCAVLGACTGGDQDPTGSRGSVQEGGPSSRDETPDTPLVDELIFGHTTPESFRVQETATLECMRARDLPYEVEAYVDRDAESQAERSTATWRAKYGYGISTSALLTERVLSDPGGASPNEAFAATLGPKQHLAYTRNLARCREVGVDLVAAQQAWFKESLPRPARDAGGALADFSNPELVTEVERWTECMRSRGHDVAGPVEAQQEIFAEYEPLQVVDESDSRLSDLREKEIALSLDDLECSEGMQVTLDRLKAELEHEFQEFAARSTWKPAKAVKEKS